MAEIGLKKRVKFAGDVHTELLKAGWDLETATLFVNNIPDADVAPVVHGRWVFDFNLDDSNFYRCSICNRQEVLLEKEDIYEWCPYCHCGARMDGE